LRIHADLREDAPELIDAVADPNWPVGPTRFILDDPTFESRGDLGVG
jgi:hypothetical protein